MLDIDKMLTRARRRDGEQKRSRTTPHDVSQSRELPRLFGRRSSRGIDAEESATAVEQEDSDPLEAIVGPAPPRPPPKVQARGRGALAVSSGIDSRFSTSYDPSTDVRLDDADNDDWDQALEALKDRQRWKQQGADRLRAAGFTQEEVTKWENGGEKREEDVKWKKKGEGREWDRGKVVDVDGQVVLEPPEWGRLKGT